ncbi:Cyclin-like protein [Pseudocohnilembus persalinus]|uniref:Cyclin-like protein n=1 Tax=Pseudocohnilembus persalinus TaxID=266149 RepID=A0A0V0QBK6_PSEPJ|nr:Cyclin-like protein [Pseudocohnilembus persalinus]|eukprot:KRW99546.1 Cyclin-like protein [Pseudocohnilembus persalinus]
MQILEVDPNYFNYNIYTQEKLEETKLQIELNKQTLELVQNICYFHNFDQSVFQKAAYFYNRVVILTEIKNKSRIGNLNQKIGFDRHLFALASLFLVTKINDQNYKINLDRLTKSFLLESYKLKQKLLQRQEKLENEHQRQEFIQAIEAKKISKYVQAIQLAEQKLLKKTGFDFNIEVADPYLQFFLGQKMIEIPKLKKKSLELAILDFSKDIYKTTLCNYFPPLVIAIAIIIEALKKTDIEVSLSQILSIFQEVIYENIEEEISLIRKGYSEIQLILNGEKKLTVGEERQPDEFSSLQNQQEIQEQQNLQNQQSNNMEIEQTNQNLSNQKYQNQHNIFEEEEDEEDDDEF